MHEASRTLLKSPPELWAECSDAASLNRHLDSFGEIRIIRLEPETAVAWEGDTASGTVRLEPSGWGTRVILTAEGTVAADEEAGPEQVKPGPVALDPVVPEPDAVVPEPDAVVPGPDAVVPDPDAVVPGPDTVVPDPDSVGPEPPVAVAVESAPEPVVAEPVGEAGFMPGRAVEPEPEPAAPTVAQPAPRGGFLTRIKLWMRGPGPTAESPAVERTGEVEAVPEVEPVGSGPEAAEPEREDAVVAFALETELESEAEAGAEPGLVTASGAVESTPVDALTQALDSLGKAHHRPFSRS
jgi:hypothetical protein